VNENLFGQLSGAGKVASTGSASIFGVEIALVTNVQDPQKLGRVKVCFPRMPGMPESDWSRVVQPAGGPGRGFYWLPEVNDAPRASAPAGPAPAKGRAGQGKPPPAIDSDDEPPPASETSPGPAP